MFARSHLVWKDNKLYAYGNEEVLFEVVPVDKSEAWHPGYFTGWKGFWRIKFPEGDLSLDYYNLTHARENCMNAALEILNRDIKDCPQKPAGEFNGAAPYMGSGALI